MLPENIDIGLTFDDVLLVPARSTVLPSEVSLETILTRNIFLGIPLVSAAMDTVTEAHTAIAMAQEGGIGILHKNMSPARQASEVDKVKKSESGMIVDPITMDPDRSVSDALDLMAKYRISGVPITEGGKKEGKLVGILTNRDLRFETKLQRPIREVMTSKNLVTVRPGIGLEIAKAKLHEHRIE
ncbi:MAG: IMP dehydrogenase, partial [Pseudomonadota bacterium]